MSLYVGRPVRRPKNVIRGLSVMVVLGLTAAAFAADEAGAPAGETKETQELKQQLADQQKQIEELRLILLGQKKQIDGVAAAQSATPVEETPAKSNVGDVASIAPIVPPLPAAPAPNAVVPPAPAPGPQASAASQVPDSPLQLKVGGTTITPIGFMDFTNTWRSTADGDSLKTNFGHFPYNNSLPLARDTEDKMSLQNSRIGARFDGAYKDWHYLGYWESDFVGDFAGNNTQVTSNSVLLRLRLYWVSLRNKHFEVQGGQSWSLLTPNRNGLSALPGDLFYGQEFDVNYLNGLTWGRIPGVRFLFHPSEKVTWGLSLENSSQYFGGSGGGAVPTLPSALSSSMAGELDQNVANGVATPNVAPDVISKLAFDPISKVHVEIGGVVSEVKLFNPSTQLYFTKAGAGGFLNGNFEIAPGLRLITNNFWSDGEGRYLFGVAPDFIVRANGSPSMIHSGSTLDGFEYTKGNMQFYGYYGGIDIDKDTALDANGTTLIGYGYKGSSNSFNRTTQEGTIGWNQTWWKDAKYGAFQTFLQYAYFFRDPWYVNLAAGAPRNTHEDAVFFDIRYLLPGQSPSVHY